MKWICKRCEKIFDDSNKQCDCKESPSPWIPYIEIEIEKVEIKAGKRRLAEEWTVELEKELNLYYYESRWDRMINYFKRLF